MLWYGYIYYITFIFLAFIAIVFALRLFYLQSAYNSLLVKAIFKNILSFFVFFSFISLVTLYFLLDFFSSFQLLSFRNNPAVLLSANLYVSEILDFEALNLNILAVYYFPFIYIFVLITLLSILFCLSYNVNELGAFMLYCTVILLSGYIIFFTDSIILFFLAYEMLLIPSFFILYNFAKTRRCVEAAYLMFFWTQFGALFLIFSFLYLFFLVGTSSFFVTSTFHFSTFELNFLFMCWFIGFGVKLPIWPFYGWLPKAHVEASTNFSIFLSGVLVKFAFFGLLKCLVTIQLEPTFYFVYNYWNCGRGF